MLERVPLLEKDLVDFTEVAGPTMIERVRALAEPLKGMRVLHVNATAYGGGARAPRDPHTAPQNLGSRPSRQVIHGSDEVFAVTKAVRNALQGADIPWTPTCSGRTTRRSSTTRCCSRATGTS